MTELKQIRFVDYLSIIKPPLTPEAREAVAQAHKTIKEWLKKQPKPPTFIHAKEQRVMRIGFTNINVQGAVSGRIQCARPNISAEPRSEEKKDAEGVD